MFGGLQNNSASPEWLFNEPTRISLCTKFESGGVGEDVEHEFPEFRMRDAVRQSQHVQQVD